MKKMGCLLLLLCAVPCVFFAQIQGVVYENGNGFIVPFASVKFQHGGVKKVVIADNKGQFSIPQSDNSEITITCMGYVSKDIQITENQHTLTIYLDLQIASLNEITVTPANNPALQIIRKVLKNKDINNFEKQKEYSYRCYLKSLLEVQSVGTQEDKIRNDSTAYVSETVSMVSKQGSHKEEKIVANRTSGIQSPILGQAMYSISHKAISFYNSSIPLYDNVEKDDRMNTDYISPLCDACLSLYNFYLENTYIQENQLDTIFEISYFPRKNQNINGLIGTMFISSDGYALSEIVAQPYQKAYFDFCFKQTYEKKYGQWFPAELEQTVDFSRFAFAVQSKDKKKINFNFKFLYYFNVKISDFQNFLNEKLSYRLEKIFLDNHSIEQNKNRFDEIRPVPLTVKESMYYHKTDSILNKKKIFKNLNYVDFMLNLFEKLPQTKVGIGKFDIDLGRIISENSHEDTRLGMGGFTNEKFLKHFSTGGYVGYGTKDGAWKYGVSGELILQKSHELRLMYLYQNTLKETGKTLASTSLEWNDNYYRNFATSRFEWAKEHKAKFTWQPLRSLQLQAAFSAKTLTPLFDYTFRGATLKNYAADDVYLSVRYAFNENFGTIGNERYLAAAGNPIVGLNYTRGVDFIRANSLIYNKLEAYFSFSVYDGRIGQTDVQVAGGTIDRSLPCGLLFTGEGSRSDFVSFLVPRTFQTMLPYEFLTDRYLRLFFSHNFGSLLLRTKKWRPELQISYNAEWGTLHEQQAHSIDFKIPNHIFQETGLTVSKLFSIPIMNMFSFDFGIGAFYRVGYYTLPRWDNNLALKMNFTVTF